MTTDSNDRRWLYASRPEEEFMFRVSCGEGQGELDLPEVGRVHLTRMAQGAWCASSDDRTWDLSIFEEGDIVARTLAGFGIERLPKRRAGRSLLKILPLAIVGVLLTSAICMRSFSYTKSQDENEEVQEAVEAVVPTPQPTVEIEYAPEEINEEKPAPKQERKERTPSKAPIRKQKKSTEWSVVERQAKEAFQKGDLSRARSLLNEIRSHNNGDVPASLRSLDSEIFYAVCQNAYQKKEWLQAAGACEHAVKRSAHRRAKQILDLLESQAQRLYLEGYVMETTDAKVALDRYKQVLRVAPSSSLYREKAIGKLKAIGGVRVD